MQILGLDGKIYKWNPLNDKRIFSSTSSYHNRAKALIKEVYPYDRIIEEVDLPGTKTAKNGILRADFFIPTHKKLIEVHGEQHYEFNSFHYESKADFRRAKNRDLTKIKWCEQNNITYIELPYDEDDDEWRNRILCLN